MSDHQTPGAARDFGFITTVSDRWSGSSDHIRKTIITTLRPGVLLLLMLLITSTAGQAQPPNQTAPSDDSAQDAGRKRFNRLDADKSGTLAVEEFTKGVKEDEVNRATRDFRVFDFDADGLLAADEFRALNAIRSPQRRGGVPDPILRAAAAAQKRLITLLRSQDQNRDDKWDINEWRGVANHSRLAAAVLEHFEAVDRRADSLLSPDEIQAAVEFAYGLSDEDGVKLRLPDGRVFNWRTYASDYDKDGDGVLSSEEFVSRVSGRTGQEKAETLHLEIDTDQDSTLNRTELVTHGTGLSDTVRQFLNLDTDLDGLLAADELTAKLPNRNKSFAPRLIPAFDTDDDGKLSFVEFRSTPAANPFGNWNDRRTDDNGDGRLDVAEFHRRDELRLFGLSGLFFDRFDTDDSGYLEPSEYEFRISLSVKHPDVVFRQFDADGDGLLTVEEATADPADTESEQPEGLDLLLSWHTRLFEQADGNGDGKLSAGEFRGSVETVWAVINRQRNRNTLLARFLELDADGNRALNGDEWLSSLPEDRRAADEVYAILCDFNGNGQLEFAEYMCLPRVQAIDQRGPVPDPVVEAAQRAMARILEASGNGGVTRTADTFAAKVAELVPGVTTNIAAAWDTDKDGTLTDEEIRVGLEVSFGVLAADGTPLRRRGVRFFRLGAVLDWDTDGDGNLTHEEFFAKQPKASDDYRARMKKADTDGNGQLTVSEMVNEGVLFYGIFGEFLKFDADRNGRITEQEFQNKAPAWQRWLANDVIPAFDGDEDGELSFPEFRLYVIVNPVNRWGPRRQDLDHDGHLNPDEFHAFSKSSAVAFSRIIFDRVDRNDDGLLDLSEVDFDVDLDRVPSEVAFRIFDGGGNGRLSIAEAASVTDTADAPEFLLPTHASVFRSADQNGDAEVSANEFRESAALLPALRTERRLRSNVLPKYIAADTDGDQSLSREEWIESLAERRRQRGAAEFTLCDFDGDGRLQFPEYASLPSAVSAFTRAPFPDPVADEARRIRGELIRSLSENTDRRQLSESADAIAQTVPGATADVVRGWDSDQNGLLDDTEAALGVDVAFGLRHTDGSSLRTPGGMIFSLRSFQVIDADGDGVVSADDLGPMPRGDRKQLLDNFDTIDVDGDQRLSAGEVIAARRVWRDIVGEFLNLDVDGNGQVNQQELNERIPGWYTRFSDQMLPGFDENGDGAISFVEFRKSPLSNPLADWVARPRDRDNDGRLSFDEYHPRKAAHALRGLSHMFLARLDVDDDGVLDLSELDFAVDVRHMPPDRAFSFLDPDDDGRITRREAVAIATPSGDQPATRFLLQRNADLFTKADSDGNGSLDEQEVVAESDVLSAILDEQRLRGRVLPGFSKKDADGNGALSLAEWLTDIPEPAHNRASAEFHACDFDRSAELAFAEYTALPRVASPTTRGPVPDPVVDAAKQVWSALMTELGTKSESRSIADVQKAVIKASPPIRGRDVVGWDTDGDRQLSPNEIRLGVDVSFGVRHFDGAVMRPDNGTVFRLNTATDWDTDGDGQLSHAEYMAKRPNSEAKVKRFDGDGDGQLTVAELIDGEFIQTDVLRVFIRIDGNADGEIDEAEIAERATKWELPYLVRVIPAFDHDRSGALSFLEFREVPAANPLASWVATRQDADSDGGLSLDEFYPGNEARQRNAAAMIFARYDLDESGLLDVDEWDFRFDLTRVPVEKVFGLADADADGRLTRTEVTVDFNSPKAGDLFASSFIVADHERLFGAADGNGDGVLDLPELQKSPSAAAAIGAEWYLRRDVLPKFGGRDGDGDGRLSRAEWMDGVAENNRARERAKFTLADFDRNDGLSFEEFICVLGISRVRGTIPDPIRDRAQEVFQQLMTRLGGTGASKRGIADAAPVITEVMRGVTIFGVSSWDSDEDGELSDDELRLGVDAGYGLRHRDGTVMRPADGRVFNLTTFQSWDQNSDGQVSLIELDARTKYSGEKITAMVTQMDHDGNGQLSLAELAAGDSLWTDSVAGFLRLDTDGSGTVNAEELNARVPNWMRQAAKYVFPGFDIDQDGELSFREYRASIIADQLRNWGAPIREKSHDGRISLQEFHRTDHWTLSGLTQMMFDRLDQDDDGWLSPDEARITLNVRRLPPDQSHALLDADHDGRLSVSELTDWIRSDAGPKLDAEKLESRIMHAEDAFYESDQDDDNVLSVEEYSNVESGLASFVAAGASPKRARTANATSDGNTDSVWTPRTIGLVVLNLVLICGVGWFLFPRKPTPAN